MGKCKQQKKSQKILFHFFRIEISLHLRVQDNQISLNFGFHNNQNALRFEVPDNPISLHLGAPTTSLSGPGLAGRIVIVWDPQMEWNLVKMTLLLYYVLNLFGYGI